MKNIGQYIALAGLFAIGLDFVNMVPSVLMWIYNWGEMVAWGIKIGLVVIGGVLFFIGGKQDSE